ncbi:hypothetical protein [Paraburkholderia unamae]|uniref:Uncharacterized protein n=1 Tax=Paraburkholderia unamae TaxID=219649 RepID=A0ABX5KTV6_9BURK|nr:hypothetical protein [Paraburkholderia unamae]PVX86466.1 hypothetical protein C7402_102302 [Paraburkholderia unamae]
MTDRIKIISDGTSMGTRVLNADGAPVPGVMRVEILPIEPNGIVVAHLTVGLVELDIDASVTESRAVEHTQNVTGPQ